MNKQIPYASLFSNTTDKKGEIYYIRFPAACRKFLGGAKKCYVLKTDGLKYIIVQPIINPANEDKPWTHTLSPEKDNGAIRISVTGKVNNGFLPKQIFGTKYKIKRRAKNGSIYICLDEPIQEDEP